MAQVYNPSHLRGKVYKHHSLKTVQAKSSQDPMSTNDWAQWYTPVMPALQGSTNERIVIHSSLVIKARSYLKNNQLKKSW
jgi:hypothetical protein